MTPTLYRLVTLQEAKDQLGLLDTQTADDDRIDRLVIDVSQAIMDYIGSDSISLDGWTDTDGNPLVDAAGNPLRIGAQGDFDSEGVFVFDLDSNGDPIDEGISAIPGPVRKAALLMIANADDDREGVRDALTPGVRSLLARFRDPPIA